MGSGGSGVIRLELASPGQNIVDGLLYNMLVTLHGLVMIFFFVMPMLIRRFGNWLIPFLVVTSRFLVNVVGQCVYGRSWVRLDHLPSFILERGYVHGCDDFQLTLSQAIIYF